MSRMAHGGGVFLMALLALASPALAQSSVTLKSTVTDGDGRITLGDLFDGADAASNVQVGTRSGATAVLDAGIVQMIAARAGVIWPNPQGLRRIIVSQGADGDPAPAETAATAPARGNIPVLTFVHAMNAGDVVQAEDLTYAQVAAVSGSVPSDPQAVIGKTVRFPMRDGAIVHTADLTSPTVVHRSETVAVTWSQNGMSLTMDGLAQKDAAAGDLIQVQNPSSKKLIDVVITGPGQAVAGDAANQLRNRQILLSSR